MAVAHRPLFGMTCPELPLPEAGDADISLALEGAGALRAAIERTPAPVVAAGRTLDTNTPAPEPDIAPSGPSFGPGRR